MTAEAFECADNRHRFDGTADHQPARIGGPWLDHKCGWHDARVDPGLAQTHRLVLGGGCAGRLLDPASRAAAPLPDARSSSAQAVQKLKSAPGWSCDACLHTLLAKGPRNSRDVLAELAALKFTPKQARRARERLGVLIERAGNGRAMHSTWRLPGEAATADTTAAAPADAAPEAPAARGAMGGEQPRHRARVQAFMAMGHDADTARAVADALAARDRSGRSATGSCAECQNVALRQCPATPRPVTEIYECWSRRQCTP